MKKILLVEDDLQLVRMYQIAFASMKVKFVSALDGVEAVNKALKERPDLILLDIVMPKMNGVDALKRIRETDVLKNIPVFMLTVLNQDNDIKMCRQLGAEEFLIKTEISPDDVVEKVEKRLQLWG